MHRIIALLKDKQRLYSILFTEDDKYSKPADLAIMVAIVLCAVSASLESVVKVSDFSFSALLHLDLTAKGVVKASIILLEYLLSFAFTLEYLLRIYCSPVKRTYVLSFFGVIDFLATIPQLLSIFFPPLRYFSVMRTFRLIRIFRVLRLFTFINEGIILLESIRRSMTKILVYFLFVIVMVSIIGTIMYIVEGGQPDTQFTDIPTSIYWAIVTLTTVGYGDITPTSAIGQTLSALVMVLGYTIIAIPTGIVSANMIDVTKKKGTKGRCPRCNQPTDLKANYCKHCGERL